MSKFKVGERVHLTTMGHDSIATIKKITPTGIIKLDDSGLSFNPRGGQRGEYLFNSYMIRKLTAELELRLTRAEIIHSLKKADLEKITLEGLLEIKKIINGSE